MKAEIIATVILEIYNNGHVREGSKKLFYEDFLQMVYMARAEILRDQFKEDLQLGEMPVLSSMLSLYVLEVKQDGNKKIAVLPGEVVVLPRNAGVYSVTGKGPEKSSCQQIFPSEPGSEWAICRDSSGVAYYIPYKKEIHLFNLNDCFKHIEAVLILNDESTTIPDDIGLKMARNILNIVWKMYMAPIKKVDDGNPNIDDVLKTKLSAPQINA